MGTSSVNGSSESSDSASSASSSRSASPIPTPSAGPAKRSALKSSKPNDARNEGTNPHWSFKPPEGTVLLDHDVDTEDFDWDAVKDDEDVDIWLVRAPAELKPKYFNSLKLESPQAHTSCIGNLQRKNLTYDVWSIPPEVTLSSANESLPAAATVAVEEIRGLSCLLPRKRNSGKLYNTPKPISQHVVITPQPPRASSPQRSTAVNEVAPHDMYQNPPRPSYPPEVLKHRFLPNGARVGTGATNNMDIESSKSTVPNTTDEIKLLDGGKVIDQKEKEDKTSKRKGGRKDEEIPKKQKKVKVA